LRGSALRSGPIFYSAAKIDPVAAFPSMPRLVDDAILRNIDDFDKPGAGQFQAPSRCCILRIAGNPKALKLQMGISSASAREA
jgi:hypothetical protein